MGKSKTITDSPKQKKKWSRDKWASSGALLGIAGYFVGFFLYNNFNKKK